MGKETKFGLAIIAILLIVFGAVLYRKIRGSFAAPTVSIPSQHDPADAAGSDQVTRQPTIVQAKESPQQLPVNSGFAEDGSRWQGTSSDPMAEQAPPSPLRPPRASFLPATSAEDAGQSHRQESHEEPEQQVLPPAGVHQSDESDAHQHLPPPGEDYYSEQLPSAELPRPAADRDEDTPQDAEQQSVLSRFLSEDEAKHNAIRARRRWSTVSDQEHPGVARFASQAAHQRARSEAPRPDQSHALSDQQDLGVRLGAQQTTPLPNQQVQQPSSAPQRPARDPIRLSSGKYTVRPGDTFWSISQQVYGTGGYFKALAEHNRGRHPRANLLRVGDRVLVPEVNQLHHRYPGKCPKKRHVHGPAGRMMAVSSGGARLAGQRIYVVKQGDTLFEIARFELGKASRWVQIHQLNLRRLGEDFDYLPVGMQLILPSGQQADTITRQPREPLR